MKNFFCEQCPMITPSFFTTTAKTIVCISHFFSHTKRISPSMVAFQTMIAMDYCLNCERSCACHITSLLNKVWVIYSSFIHQYNIHQIYSNKSLYIFRYTIVILQSNSIPQYRVDLENETCFRSYMQPNCGSILGITSNTSSLSSGKA